MTESRSVTLAQKDAHDPLLYSVSAIMNPCLSQGKKREFRFHQLKETYIDEPADITPFVDQLDEALKERVLQLQKGW